MPDHLVPNTYNRLRGEIGRILESGKERAWRAVETEKVQTYWDVGRLLHEHLLEHRERAGYGEQLLVQLARDLEINQQRLYEMLKFSRLFPILRPSGKLGWSHYLALLSLSQQTERERYAHEAERQAWSVRELKAHIQAETFSQNREGAAAEQPARHSAEPALPALRGQLYTYRLVEAPNASGLRLDVGFGTHIVRPLPGIESPRPGMVVETYRANEGTSSAYRFRETQGRQAAFYTYRANVSEVIDGDTLWVDIDCGFGIWTHQKLRLRGIDTPELPTPEGVRAKGFVSAALTGLPFVALTTTKPDKYDRYLADIFYLPGEADPQRVAQHGAYLNRQLVEGGLAERVRE